MSAVLELCFLEKHGRRTKTVQGKRIAMITREIVRRTAALPLGVKGLSSLGLAACPHALPLRRDGWFDRIAAALPEEIGEP